ncbi:MAG: ribonuclease Z [DPANN group archaeon]|nr:ribonuclease Z [DPANN group archaeon]
MKLTILGTGSAMPTPSRQHSATALDIGPEVLLFDCGEGTQLQLMKAGISHNKISKIFITHWHGDHVLGLPGLIQSMSLNKRTKPLNIYGPAKTRENFRKISEAFGVFPTFKASITELKPGAFNAEKYSISVANAKHNSPCLAFAFQEKPKVKVNLNYLKKFVLVNNPIIGDLIKGKDIVWQGKKIKAKDATFLEKGKKIVYLLDSAYSKHLENFAKDADALLCEATFADDMKDFAKEFGHMTATQAATLAKKANVKKLIITHFSQRYKDTNILLKEAKKVFADTVAAKDLITVEI